MHNPLHPHDACRPAAPRRPAPGGGGDRLRPRPAQGLIRARPRPRRAAPDRSAARARAGLQHRLVEGQAQHAPRGAERAGARRRRAGRPGHRHAAAAGLERGHAGRDGQPGRAAAAARAAVLLRAHPHARAAGLGAAVGRARSRPGHGARLRPPPPPPLGRLRPLHPAAAPLSRALPAARHCHAGPLHACRSTSPCRTSAPACHKPTGCVAQAVVAGYLLGAPRAHSASHATGAPAQAAGEWGEPALLALHYAWTAGLAFACLAPAQAIAYLLLAQACARCPARVRIGGPAHRRRLCGRLPARTRVSMMRVKGMPSVSCAFFCAPVVQVWQAGHD